LKNFYKVELQAFDVLTFIFPYGVRLLTQYLDIQMLSNAKEQSMSYKFYRDTSQTTNLEP